MRKIAHVDVDAFFVSVALRKRPELKGKPVLVCTRTDHRGIVVCASYEARPFGIRAGTPLFKVRELCPQAVLLTSEFKEYEILSWRLMELLRTFSPDVEPASIDEAYVDLTGLCLLNKTSYEGLVKQIQEIVLKELGLSVSIGLAPTKLLAKIASGARKPAGCTIIRSHTIHAFLRSIPVKKIPGIGFRTQPLLERYNITTAEEVATDPRIPEMLGKRGVEMQQELNGTSLFRVHADDRAPQSLSKTSTFPDFSGDQRYIYHFFLDLLHSIMARLHSYELETGGIHMILIEKNFTLHTHKELFNVPTDEEDLLLQAFQRSFDSIFTPDRIYRKAGIIFEKLSLKGPKQTSLFDQTRRGDITKTLVKIREKHGALSVIRGIFMRK